MPPGIPRDDENPDAVPHVGDLMSRRPEHENSNAQEPIWAVETPEPVWEEPATPQARAWFSLGQRTRGVPARLASRAAGLVVVGALMTTGVAIAAFADDGGTPDPGTSTIWCSETITTECEERTESAETATEEAPASEPTTSAAAEPEATEPEATEPEATEPEVTEPDVTEPETTEPAATEPDATDATDASEADADLVGDATGSDAADPPAPPTNALPAVDPPVTTASVPAVGASALDGLELAATETYYQVPGEAGAPNDGSGAATGSAGEGDSIEIIGISALALFQLQRASSLLPPPAPLPDIRELDAAAMKRLQSASRRTGVGWTVLAAAKRLGLRKGQTLVSAGRFLKARGAGRDAARPFEAEKALAAYFGSKEQGERAAALAAYYWAVGADGVTAGLQKATPAIESDVLASKHVSVYGGGRGDLEQHRIDARVLMVIRYLEASFGSVQVTSLISGHSIFSKSGNVSAHIFGRAVDIAAVGGTPILGNQGPLTATERAVRLLLMLPPGVAPRQIISLMDLDGATGNAGSFALPDHGDHIHVGF